MMVAVAARQMDSMAVDIYASGVELLGEVVMWEMTRGEIRYADLVDNLKTAGLNPDAAAVMLPKNAFKRACRRLRENRIIRELDKDGRMVSFQFTQEQRVDGALEYHREAVMVLDTESGAITCAECPALADLAREHLADAIAYRTSNDITRIVQRLFDEESKSFPALFPVRKKGGVYFVPHEYRDFLEKISQFVRGLGGDVKKLPIPKGSLSGDRAIKDTVTKGIEELIADYEQAVTSFCTDTTFGRIERYAERVKLAKHKVESYEAYLEDNREKLTKSLAAVQAKLKDKVKELAKDEKWSEKNADRMERFEKKEAAELATAGAA